MLQHNLIGFPAKEETVIPKLFDGVTRSVVISWLGGRYGWVWGDSDGLTTAVLKTSSPSPGIFVRLLPRCEEQSCWGLANGEPRSGFQQGCSAAGGDRCRFETSNHSACDSKGPLGGWSLPELFAICGWLVMKWQAEIQIISPFAFLAGKAPWEAHRKQPWPKLLPALCRAGRSFSMHKLKFKSACVWFYYNIML